MQAHLSPAYVELILAAMKDIRLGQELSVLQAQRLLGLMVAAANIIPLGLLHIRPFQLKSRGFNPLNHPSRFLRVMRHGLRVL